MQFRIWVLCFLLFSSSVLRIANSLDPYKVLGVDRNANQRDVQKAFHKLSLKYHPDKNKEKTAETKFAEINNAYEILSDEQKRKNYDLYGDEKGAPNADFGSGGQQYHNYGGPQDGSTYSDGSFGQEFWFSNTQKGSNSQSFSFSYGNPSSRSSSSQYNFQGSGFPDNLFSILNEIFSGQTKHDSGYRESQNIQAINSKSFRSEVLDKGLTWLLLFYTPNTRDQVLESVVDEVAGSLRGGLKAGMVNCQDDWSLCKKLGATPRDEPRIFIYSDGIAGKGSVVEYQGYSDSRQLKEFCQKNFPRHSKRISINDFDFSSSSGKPRVILLTNKKQTPLIWRALSGLYHNNMEFFDVEVSDTSGVVFGNLKLGKLPAIVGIFPNGVKHIIIEGWAAKDMESAIDDIGKSLVEFQKKNAASANQKGKETETESGDQRISLLTKSSVDELCGEHVAVCIVGVFKSSASKDKLESLLSTVSQKIMTRPGNSRHGLKNSISYVLLDGNKQYKFIKSFDMKSSDKALLAYKPRKEKYAVFYGDLTEDEVEDFVSSVLNGDTRFKKIERRTELK